MIIRTHVNLQEEAENNKPVIKKINKKKNKKSTPIPVEEPVIVEEEIKIEENIESSILA